MASSKAVAGAMALLAEAHPSRQVTPQTIQVYAGALRDVSDEALSRAVAQAINTLKFFPAPAELREFAGANRPLEVDTEALLTRISNLGQYTPTSGMSWPSVGTVRDQVGHEVSVAYSIAGGGERLFSGNETTRSISRREFAAEYRLLLRDHGAPALPLPARAPAPQLASGTFHARPVVTTTQPGFRRLSAVLEERAS